MQRLPIRRLQRIPLQLAPSVEETRMEEVPHQSVSWFLSGGKNLVSVLMQCSHCDRNTIKFIITGQTGQPNAPGDFVLQAPLNLSFSLFSPTFHSSVVVNFLLREEVDSYFCPVSAEKKQYYLCPSVLYHCFNPSL